MTHPVRHHNGHNTEGKETDRGTDGIAHVVWGVRQGQCHHCWLSVNLHEKSRR